MPVPTVFELLSAKTRVTKLSRTALFYALKPAGSPADASIYYRDVTGPRLLVKDYADVNTGTDQSGAINAAIADAVAANVPIELEGGEYGIGASLDGSLASVRFIGVPGLTKFKKLNTGGTSSILTNAGSRYYQGWSFEGVEFDGNGIAIAGLSMVLTDTSDIVFRRCAFRHLTGAFTLQAANKIYFEDCRLFGAYPGLMASGTYDPAAVTGAAYGSGFQVNGGCNDILFSGLRSHFVNGAVVQGGSVTNHSKGFTVWNSRFRGDYWNGPILNLRFSITAYNSGTGVATVGAGGLTGHFPAGISSPNFASVAVTIATGSNLAYFAGIAVTTGSFGAGVRTGDVLETVNGKRLEILSVVDTQHVQGAEWESMDTFEPTSAPASNTAWRVNRYYAAAAEIVDSTHLQFFFEPVDPFTGELITAAGHSVPWTCRELPNIGYAGVHIGAGSRDTLIAHSWFRGSFADQISLFDTPAPRVIGNTVECGQDEGTTLTRCPYALAEGNTYRYSGVSAIFCASDHASLVGNTIDSWACMNRAFSGRGAIELQGRHIAAKGNTFGFNETADRGGASPYSFSSYLGDISGSVISGNTGRGRSGQVNLENQGLGDPGPVYVSDVFSIDGNRRDQAVFSDGRHWALRERVAEYFKLEDATGSKYGVTLTNNGTVTFAAGKVGNGAVFGASKWLSSPDNPLFRMGDFDFEFTGWFKLASLANGYIFGKGTGAAATYEYSLLYNSSPNSLLWQVSNGTTLTSLGGSFNSFVTGTWYHFRCGYDRLNGLMFLQVNNGTLDTTAHAGGAQQSTNAFALGALTGGSSPLDGMIDEFGIFKHHILNSDDRSKIYGAGSGLAWPLL